VQYDKAKEIFHGGGEVVALTPSSVVLCPTVHGRAQHSPNMCLGIIRTVTRVIIFSTYEY